MINEENMLQCYCLTVLNCILLYLRFIKAEMRGDKRLKAIRRNTELLSKYTVI